jgi:hypothetical protein
VRLKNNIGGGITVQDAFDKILLAITVRGLSYAMNTANKDGRWIGTGCICVWNRSAFADIYR